VLIHTDTELGAKDLINTRMAYAAVSRAHDAQLFTKGREKHGTAFGHNVSHRSAHAPELKLARQLENVGVSAYPCAAPLIDTAPGAGSSTSMHDAMSSLRRVGVSGL